MCKLFFCLFFVLTSSCASCVSNIYIKFDFEKNSIKVKSDIISKKEVLNIDYENFNVSKAFETDENVGFSYEKNILDLNENYVYLLNAWYPNIENRCIYNITTNLNTQYKAVSTNIQSPQSSVSFIASKNFYVNEQSYKNIKIRTYFLIDDVNLAKKYLEQSVKYIKMFEKRIGEYPYKTFTIVENIYQTGYALPSYTLIGSALLKKPYILEQSLAHEILHQYFGSSISNKSTSANWLEGITTYLADNYLKKQNNSDKLNRKMVLSEFANYVDEKEDYPISEFKQRSNKSSMLIGYSKFSFILFMLESKIGTTQFNTLVKIFYASNKNSNISLEEFVAFFVKHASIPLSEFFDQWFYNKGLIDLKIENEKSYYDKEGFWISFEITQNSDKVFHFDLPIKITTYDKTVMKTISIHSKTQNIKLKFASEVLSITLDENYHLFRKLSKKEQALNLSAVLTQTKLLAVVNKEHVEKYKFIYKLFPTINVVLSKELKYTDLKQNSVIFLDKNNEVLKQFIPNIKKNKNSSFFMVKPHVYNKAKTMSVMHLDNLTQNKFRHIKYYSKYNEIVFEKENTVKNSVTTQNGIQVKFNDTAKGSKIETNFPISKIFEKIHDKKIIYVSESHNNFNHHLNQLRVIKSLHQNGKKIVIAMEMFQKQFQSHIDAYIQGKSDLNEFLKNTQYFSRWKFDYSLYKPILDYAKANKLKVLAINVDRGITSKVSKEGLFSLNTRQKSLLPKNIDQTNLIYQERLNTIFTSHMPKQDSKHQEKPQQINLDFFYQSQLVWDEVMAENISTYLKQNSEVTMVVLAGSGHTENHDGIPSRVYRRTHLPFIVILNDTNMSKAGDIVLTNRNSREIIKAKKLGVFLKSSTLLMIKNIKEDSVSSKIGLAKDDLIVAINNEPVKTLADLKRILYLLDSFENLSIKVKRDSFYKVLKYSK